MRIFLVSFLQILVVIGNSYQECNKELENFSEEDDSDSSSGSDEESLIKKSNEQITAASDEKVEFSAEDVITEKKPKDNATEPPPPCANEVYSAEDRSTTTLINYPFAVSVQRKGSHYTTGALLDKWWILTSAGEFYNIRESIKLIGARLGSVDCKKGGTKVPIKRIEIHPLYVYKEPNFDLALLRIAQPVDFTDFIRPIGLSQINKKVISAKFLTTYWPTVIIVTNDEEANSHAAKFRSMDYGYNEVKGQPLPASAQERIKKNSMRVSTQRLIPRERCHLHLKGYDNIHESTLCLKPIITHHSTCKPDSGAPLVAEDGLWGITSGWTAENCTQNPSPTVFTRLSVLRVRAWLDSEMLARNNPS